MIIYLLFMKNRGKIFSYIEDVGNGIGCLFIGVIRVCFDFFWRSVNLDDSFFSWGVVIVCLEIIIVGNYLFFWEIRSCVRSVFF